MLLEKLLFCWTISLDGKIDLKIFSPPVSQTDVGSSMYNVESKMCWIFKA